MGGKIIRKYNFFLKYTLDIITGTPRNSYELNISEIYSHSQFWTLQGDYEHEIMFLFHRNINRRENEVQIPN